MARGLVDMRMLDLQCAPMTNDVFPDAAKTPLESHDWEAALLCVSAAVRSSLAGAEAHGSGGAPPARRRRQGAARHRADAAGPIRPGRQHILAARARGGTLRRPLHPTSRS